MKKILLLLILPLLLSGCAHNIGQNKEEEKITQIENKETTTTTESMEEASSPDNKQNNTLKIKPVYSEIVKAPVIGIALVSLEDKKVYYYTEETIKKCRRGDLGNIDLWLEPSDSKIAVGYCTILVYSDGKSGEMIKTNVPYNQIEFDPRDFVWDNSVVGFDERDDIKPGFTFLYKDFKETVYKIRIDDFTDFPDTPLINITYEILYKN